MWNNSSVKKEHMRQLLRLAFGLFVFLFLGISGTYVSASQVQGCDGYTNAQPGHGVAYKGTLRNSDYGLTVQIPPGQTGWGAAPEAPFHGFAIFLAGDLKSCIFFEIHLRVDTDDHKSISNHPSATRIKLGNRNGWEEQSTGVIEGNEWTNVTVRYSIRHPRSTNEIDDGTITLVTLTQDKSKNMALFQEFISQIRFEGKDLSITAAEGWSPGKTD